MVVLARAAERPLNRLLTGGTGLLAVAVLATGCLAALDQRRDAEQVAVQAFRDDLRPVAEVVFDHLQPLAEAERQAEDDASGGFSVYVDVARDTSTGSAVRAQRAAVEELQLPPSLERLVDRLDAALEDFATAAERYEDLPFEATSEGARSLPDARRAATDALRDGLATWSAAIAELYPERPPPVPVPLDEDTQPARRPVSHPGYLLEVGRACGRADALGEAGQEEPTDAASGRRAAAAEAALVRELVAALLDVPAPAGDQARLEREVLVPLREYGRTAEVLDRLATSDATAEALFRELVAADAAAAPVALGLGDYGSRTCALYFGS